MCTRKIYRPQRNSNPVPPISESTTLPMSYPGIYIPLSRPLRGPAGALPMPWRCPPNIPGRVPLGIPTGTRRAPVTFLENVSCDSRPGARRDPPGFRQGICKTRFDHDHSARGQPGTGITAVFTARTGPGLIVT